MKREDRSKKIICTQEGKKPNTLRGGKESIMSTHTAKKGIREGIYNTVLSSKSS